MSTASFPIILGARRRPVGQIFTEVLLLGVISGLVVQACLLFGLDLHHAEIRNIGVAVVALGIANELFKPKSTQIPVSRHFQNLLVTPAMLMAVAVVASRILANGQQRYALTNLNYFGGEDNAKWLNVVAQLVTDTRVDVASVGGVCTSYLSFIVSWTRTLSPIVGFVSNEINLLISATVISEIALVVLLPLGLTPVFRFVRNRNDLAVAMPIFVVASLFLMSSSSQFLRLGQLSGQMVLLYGVVLVSHLSDRTTFTSKEMAPKLVAFILMCGLTSIWLPLQPLTIVALLIAAVIIFRDFRRGARLRTEAPLLIACVVLVPGAFLTSLDSLTYISHSDETLLNLFSAGGGTPAHTTFVGVLALLLLLLLVWVQNLDTVRAGSSVSWLFPFMTLPVMAIVMSDYLRTGKVNYGSQKMTFIVLTIIVGGLVGPVVLGLAEFVSRYSRQRLVLTSATFLLLSMTLDGSALPWLDLTKNSQWKSSQSVLDSGWARFTVITNSPSQKLTDLPIACGVIGDNGQLGVDMNTYTCTRFLTAMSGMERSAGPLVEWQLRGSWAESVPYLERLPSEVLQRKIVRLDTHGEFVDLSTLSSLLRSD